jgi:hypothetical protein
MLDSNLVIKCCVVKFLCNLSFGFNGRRWGMISMTVIIIFVIEMCPAEATSGFKYLSSYNYRMKREILFYV